MLDFSLFHFEVLDKSTSLEDIIRCDAFKCNGNQGISRRATQSPAFTLTGKCRNAGAAIFNPDVFQPGQIEKCI